MKKILVVLMIALMLATLCACSYVPATRFMSTVQVNSLAKKFDDPQAELTLDYTAKNGTKMQVVIVYKLLLTQTPLAVIRFVQLVNDGFYDNTFVDSYVSQYHYVTMGRYLYKPSTVQQNNPNAYFQNASEQTFKGEFKSNGYKEPKDGYAQFKILSRRLHRRGQQFRRRKRLFDNGFVRKFSQFRQLRRICGDEFGHDQARRQRTRHLHKQSARRFRSKSQQYRSRFEESI